MSQDKIHIMIDIETYDTKPSAVILSIGAVPLLESDREFYVELDPTTQFERTVSIATKEWWSKQPMPVPIGSTHLNTALTQLSEWLKSFEETPIIWCKGTDFDTAILTHAYNQMHLPVPWKYNNVRDCRTVFKIAELTAQRAKHNALEDAKQQANDLLVSMNRLNGQLA